MAVTALLLIGVAMAERLQPSEVSWSGFDYLIAGVLVFLMGFTLETGRLRWHQHKMRWWIIALILAIFALLWLELAVGIFGSPFAGT